MRSSRRVGLLLLLAALAEGCGEGCGRAQTTSHPVEAREAAAPAPVKAISAALEKPLPIPADVESRPATSLGTDAFTPNGRIQPHGQPTTYWFEYGATNAYGASTPPRPLPPRLASFYRESWDRGLGGWTGGMSSKDLVHIAKGGVAHGYARYTDDEGGGDDTNHLDGVGVVHLTQYFYPGSAHGDEAPTAALGGGDPDMRDARITVHVRGNQWKANGTELVWWIQCDRDLAKQNENEWRRANWAHTGFSLTGALASGTWQKVEYRLANDSNAWTYGGNSVHQNRPNYVYWSIDEALAHVNNDAFHMLVYVDQGAEPSGVIDYDELEIAYRNHSLLLPTNGAKLIAASPGSPDDAAALTDGWRNGSGRAWRGPPEPRGIVEIAYELAAPVTVERVQIHQHPEWPSKDIEVAFSEDGVKWKTEVAAALPSEAKAGPSFAFLLERDLHAKARFVKVRIVSGHRAAYWGLGEIEIFGTGAIMQTDNDWYNVNADITKGVKAGAAMHYRLVAKNDQGVVAGPDQVFLVPSGRGPEVSTGGAKRIRSKTAELQGRVNALGKVTEYWFEYGLDTKYGTRAPPKESPKEAGQQKTPRDVHALIEELEPGKPYHYRLVAKNATGTSYGRDATFEAN